MKNFKESYQRLNKQQKEAVDNIDGPMMVVAGPGSGKTELLSVRVANILDKKDIPAGSVLCLTFTDAAALNMKERLVGMIGESGYRVPTFTFHSFCKKIIDENPEFFYQGAEFNLVDRITKTEILEDILEKTDYDNPLNSKHPERGYVYLRSIKTAISDLKEGGLTPEEFKKALLANEKLLKKINPLVSQVFSKRISKSIIPKIESLIVDLKKIKADFPIDYFKPVTEPVISSLEEALTGEGTKKITAWKNKWTKKEKNERVLKDLYYIEKQKSLADIYQKYEEEMYKKGLYDFSDMILDTIKVLEENDSLRYDLQEKYQYILVDEFQDTSGVQMRLLKNLTIDEPHGKPNVCVVGDDDQAIYRFQGAEISNILNFKSIYEDVKVITLKKSYRSGQEILDASKKVIERGDERLEASLEEVDKDLVSGKNDSSGQIEAKIFQTKQEEYSYVVKKVKELISKGISPDEIAVMGRKHKILKEAAGFFTDSGIPVYAERKVNVLKNEVIEQIIEIIRFSVYLLEGDKYKADELLPNILSYPFWNLSRNKIWKLARNAHKKRISWLEEMENDKELRKILGFLTDLSKKAKYKPVDEILDMVIGNKKADYTSPLKEYYFSNENLKENPTEYFKFLSALKKFSDEFRSYKEGEKLLAEDLLVFVDRHKDNNLAINDNNPLITDSDAVSLITSHSAKGREFEAVFVLNCQHEIWGKGRRMSKLPLPSNIPVERAGENKDDQLRLFYVTLTRAKRFLTITSHKKKENGRGYSPLEFIDHLKPEKEKMKVTHKELEASRNSFYHPPFNAKEKDLLKPLVKDYMISATGLNKYLNVADEGPQSFLQDTLLRFPSKKPVAAAYGTAVHKTMGQIYNYLKIEDGFPKIDFILNSFERFLEAERLSDRDFQKYLEKGKESLKSFCKEKKESFSKDDLIEKNFRNQGVVVNDHQLTGKIDKITKNEDGKIQVFDFKTGKPLEKWGQSGKYNKIKSWKYKNQLIFYKILVEKSTDFIGSTVSEGFLEFVEPDDDNKIITLSLEIKKEDVERLKRLITIVGNRIKNLNFSTEESYNKKSIKEIEKFEDYLLKNN